MSETLTRAENKNVLEIRETTVDELARMATVTAFETLAAIPEVIEASPLMTNTTWDHGSKSTDNSDSGSGVC